ncbi:MAG: hypothetical protein K4305_10400 [Chlorobium sp.]|uniref:P-loop ATPase, Sll1717 family n=1 Tax=Chlorobium sp. TaxID=1095 RepID=UPI002F3FD5F4
MTLPAKFRFRNSDSIGAADAEEDLRFLRNCFVDIGYLDSLRDCDDPKRIVIGRTGSGKSALLLHLRELEDHVIEIKPESLALAYISNSNVLDFFSNIGVRLDVFYKLLWRHVFAVEILKHHFHINSESEKRNFLVRIRDLFKNNKKDETAIEYLEKWGKSFWQETEYRIKEITNKVEDELKASAISQVPGINFSGGGSIVLSEEQKTEIVNKAQHVVNDAQIRELSDIIDLIDNVISDRKKRYYIVIDRLDENWVDDKLRYRLVRALIETVRDFRKVRGVKIIISIRYDLLRRVFSQTRDAGFQEEKYDSLYLRMKWDRDSMKSMLDKRINYLVKQRYTNQEVGYKELLPKQIKGYDPFSYMVERTLMRPRDLISFFNYCIEQSINSPVVSGIVLLNAEYLYSRARLKSLADEWYADYPSLLDYAKILKNRPPIFSISLITDKEIEELCLAVAAEKGLRKDNLSEIGFSIAEGLSGAYEMKFMLVKIFYIVGLIGIKNGSYSEYVWSYKDEGMLYDGDSNDEVKIAIHPMFYMSFGVKAHSMRQRSTRRD